jgi:outer membrane protein assembly factor BamC
VTSPSGATPIRLTVLALAASLAACQSMDTMLSGDKIDYKSTTTKAKPLDVPPDLTQLAQQSRYQVQGGVISAAGAAATAAAPGAAVAPAAGTPTVALAAQGNLRIERDGQQRWLVAATTPEQLWPQVKAFWEQRGFTLEVENAAAGLMETNWAENRAKLPQDVVRRALGGVLGNLFDTGERDRFRTRIERTPGGSEIYISHRGAEEAYLDDKREGTRWRLRGSDPQLEAEMLSLLMLALGPRDEAARVQAQAPARAASAPEAPARARALAGSGAALELDEPFDRAWRRVGLALDRGGFSVEDRDRNAGLYYVRYVDPKSAGKEEPGFWARLFGDSSNPQAAIRYRIAVKGGASKTTVSVLTSAGDADSGDNGRNIAAALINELR